MAIKDTGDLYFAYGSNLNKQDLLNWCERNKCKYPFKEEPSFAASLVDYRLVFNHFSQTRQGYALNVMKAVGKVVDGIVFKVDGEDGWNTIDKKEGAPRHYCRVPVVVIDKDTNELVKAFTYLSNRPDTPDIIKNKKKKMGQSEGYYRLVREGYQAHGLQTGILDEVNRGEVHPTFTDTVFVYGTLMSGKSRFGIVKNRRLVSISAGEIFGRLIDLGSYPGLVDIYSDSFKVQGELVAYDNDIAALLKELDQVEGFYGMDSEGSLYYRVPVKVYLKDKQTKVAWTYLYANPPLDADYIICGRWVEKG